MRAIRKRIISMKSRGCLVITMMIEINSFLHNINQITINSLALCQVKLYARSFIIGKMKIQQISNQQGKYHGRGLRDFGSLSILPIMCKLIIHLIYSSLQPMLQFLIVLVSNIHMDQLRIAKTTSACQEHGDPPHPCPSP